MSKCFKCDKTVPFEQTITVVNKANLVVAMCLDCVKKEQKKGGVADVQGVSH
jgi:hypothetical protein